MKITPSARKLILGLLFTAPFTIGFLAFTVYPLLASFYYSFTQYSILTPPKWIGLQNYATLFMHDDLFWTSLGNTLFFICLAVPLGLTTSFVIALALNQRVRGMSIYRTIFFLPTLVPSVALAILWLWIFNPQSGMMNWLFELVGLPSLGWLGDINLAKPSLVLMSLWSTGGTIVIFLAGLQDVPGQLYEAADIDGANRLQKVWFITIPMMTPVILFNLITGIIGGFQYFTEAFIMTNGGPINATLFYALYLYRNGFQYVKMGYASAMAWILFVIVLSCTLAIFRTSRAWVYYGASR